jgi:hypothetical protein
LCIPVSQRDTAMRLVTPTRSASCPCVRPADRRALLMFWPTLAARSLFDTALVYIEVSAIVKSASSHSISLSALGSTHGQTAVDRGTYPNVQVITEGQGWTIRVVPGT